MADDNSEPSIEPPEQETIAPPTPQPVAEPEDQANSNFEDADHLGGDSLIPISEMIGNMAQFIGQIGDPEIGQVFTVEQLNFDLPIELQLGIDATGQLTLKAAPPTQQIETTVMPVFHQIKLSVVRDNEW